MALTSARASIEEREFVQKSPDVKKSSGFIPHASEWMGNVYQKPATSATLECNHLLRSSLLETASGFPALEYRLWQEAGKHPPPIPHRPDDNYNSSVWRNFRQTFGLGVPTPRMSPRKQQSADPVIDDSIAVIYPVNIPRPSRMGDHSYSRYLEDSELFSDPRRKKLAIDRLHKDNMKFHKLRAMSDARNPPIDQRGYILPPEGYKKYDPLFIPHEDVTKPEPLLITPDMQPDMFGNLVKKQNKPRLWKLTYRTNNPKYNEAMDYAHKMRDAPKIHPVAQIKQ